MTGPPAPTPLRLTPLGPLTHPRGESARRQAEALAQALCAGESRYVQGPPGSGKTHLLREVLDALDGAFAVAVDAAERGSEPALGHLVRALAATAAAREIGLETTPPDEWLAWLERGPGAAWRQAVDDRCRAEHGLDLRATRRRLGAAVAAASVAGTARALFLPEPCLLPPAEKLALLGDQLAAAGVERVIVVIDNVDSPAAEDGEACLQAVCGVLPRWYGQHWSVLLAGVGGQPGALDLPCVTLPGLTRDAVAAWLPADRPPERLLTTAAWDLLAGLLAGGGAPLGQAVEWLTVLAQSPPDRPLSGLELAAWEPVARLVADEAPDCWAALPNDAPAGDAARWLLARGTAGLASAVELADLSSALDLGPAACAAALAGQASLEVGDLVRLRPAAPAELAWATARREATRGLTRAERWAERRRWLDQLAETIPRGLVWENLVYQGEVLVADSFSPRLAGPLPPGVAWRLVLLGRAELIPDLPELDGRTVILVPRNGDSEPGLVTAAAARRIVDESHDATQRELARAWLDAREAEGPRIAERWFPAGQAVAQPMPQESWPASLAPVPAGGWPAALFRPRFRSLHRRRADWLDGDRLDEPPTEASLSDLWRELRAAPRGTGSALRAALRLGGDREPPGFAELRRALDDAGGAVDAVLLATRLCGPPWGLTPALAKLYLLAFALRAEPAVAAELLGRPGERLSGELLRSVDWDDLPHDAVRRLVRADRRSWAELVRYARALAPDLPESATPAAVSAGRLRLTAELAALRERVAAVGEALDLLAESLGQSLGTDVHTALAQLAAIAAAAAPEAFDLALDQQFGPELEPWQTALARLGRWEALVDSAEDLAVTASFAQRVELPDDHPLAAERRGLLAQLDLPRLLASPHLARGLTAQGERFRRNYQSAYRAGHDAQGRRLAELREVWQRHRATAEALIRLNGVAALGPPDGPELAAPLASLEPLLRPCSAATLPAGRPTCAACGWRLGDQAPEAQLRHLGEQLELAFARRTQRLAARLTGEIVAEQGADQLEALHQVLMLQQAARLPSVLTPETVDLLARCLPGAAAVDLLGSLRETYPSIAADEVDGAAARFADLLRQAIEAAGGPIEPR